MTSHYPIVTAVRTRRRPNVDFGPPHCGRLGARWLEGPAINMPNVWSDTDVSCGRTAGHEGLHMSEPKKMPLSYWRRWLTCQWSDSPTGSTT
jgi:hypothetical protein